MIIFSGITHLLTAGALYFLIFPFNIIQLALILLGSILPDIDHPSSLLGRYNVMSPIMEHRGFTHTILFMVIVAYITHIYTPHWRFMALGILIHLIGDTTTKTGIKWLFPFTNEKYSLHKLTGDAEVYCMGISFFYLFYRLK